MATTTLKIDGYDVTVAEIDRVGWYCDNRGRWRTYDLSRVTVAKDGRVYGLGMPLNGDAVAIVPTRRTERHCCERGHPQTVRPLPRWLPVKGGWVRRLLLVEVEPCRFCPHMERWRERLEAYYAAGDVRGVLAPAGEAYGTNLRSYPFGKETQNLAERLLMIGPWRGPSMPWRTDLARRFLDGELPHPPATNFERLVEENRAALGIAPGTPEAEAHERDCVQAMGEAMFLRDDD